MVMTNVLLFDPKQLTPVLSFSDYNNLQYSWNYNNDQVNQNLTRSNMNGYGINNIDQSALR